MEHEDQEREMLESEYANLRNSAEYNRVIAADHVYAEILRLRTEIALCYTQEALEKQRRANGRAQSNRPGAARRRYEGERRERFLAWQVEELRARHDELIATQYGTDPDLSDDDLEDARLTALEEGMADHVAAWVLSRTVCELRGRDDQPLAVADIARRYLYSEEGTEDALDQMSSYLESTLVHDPEELPSIERVLDAACDRLITVRERVATAGEPAQNR